MNAHETTPHQNNNAQPMTQSTDSYRGSTPYDPWDQRKGTARIRREYPEQSGSVRPRFNNRQANEGGTMAPAPPPPQRVIIVPNPEPTPKPIETPNPVAPANPVEPAATTPASE